jgi:hypothetical protein
MRSTTLAAFASVAAALLGVSAHADISISKRPTQNMSCSGGTCTPTARNAVLNVGDVTGMLATGDLTVQTGNGNNTAAGIEIVDSFSWISISRLTLTAKKSITVKAPVVVAGAGAFSINYNQGNVGGNLLFEKNGKIDFWDTNSSVIINGNSYALVNDIKTLAADIGTNPGGFFALARHFDAGHGAHSKPVIGTSLQGTFEGLGHSITNLKILASRHTAAALFDNIGASGVVQNLVLSAVVIRTKNYPAAALAITNYGVIRSVSVSGTVKGGQDTGGLLAINAGSVFASYASAVVTAELWAYYTGGLVGRNYGLVEHSSAAGEVMSDYKRYCFYARTGGLVGLNQGSIASSSATSNVQGGSGGDNECGEFPAMAGGPVGQNQGSIEKSFASGGMVAGYQAYAGDLVGENDGQISDSYSTASVEATDGSAAGGGS